VCTLKLNLGCGGALLKGYVNIDKYYSKADQRMDVRHLDYPDESVDEVYSSHLVEHIPASDFPATLREWLRVLKIGGRLKIRCPNITTHMRRWLAGDLAFRASTGLHSILGMQNRGPGYLNHNLFDVESLRHFVEQAGFSIISCRVVPSRNGSIIDGDLLCEASRGE